MLYTRYPNRRPRSAPTSPLKRGGVLGWPKGINTFVADEDVPKNQVRYASDARMIKLGHYATKQGAEFYTAPAGETVDDQETSTTGAADQTVTLTTWKAIKFTTTTAGRLTKIELNLKNDLSATGPVRVEIRADASGSPDTDVLVSSSVTASDIASTYAYEVARFIEAPALTTTTAYWIVVYVQESGSGTYNISSTTTATTALTSANSGTTWSATSYDLNFKTYLSTNSPTLGAYRAYKSTGTKTTLLAHGTNVYTVNDTTGALSSIKSGLSGSATRYYFEKANDVVYYVNGFDAPREWDFTTEAAMGGSPSTAKLIKLHKNQLFFVDATDTNKIFWSDIGDFEVFTSTNFLYVPSPKHTSPITAWESLNDVLYIFTEQTKYAIYGSDIATFEVTKAAGTKGTYTPECLQLIRNHVYFLSDDGVYKFNGNTDELISAEVTDIVRDISDKSKCVTGQYENRFYLFYPSAGSAVNDQCLVYNIDFDIWESIDLATYVGRTLNFNTESDNGEFILFSNLVGQGFYNERTSNNYSQLGRPLTFEVRPRYELGGNPESQSQIKRLYPRFRRLSTSDDVDIYYDSDFRNSPTYLTTVDLVATSNDWGGGAEWGDGTTWGGTTFVDQRISIPVYSQAIQPRYLKEGVDTPVHLAGQVYYFKTKRAR